MAAGLGNTATRLPLIVILGATGTGKSKLALEIAARFQGEIISADSMQVYRGLDIITNKVTKEELAQAPHHLLGFLDPLARFTVTDFRNAALPVIERLQRERKVPVVVGGTNYYIEALLWKVLVDSDGDSGGDSAKLIYERDCEVYGGDDVSRVSASGGDGGGGVCDGEKACSGSVRHCEGSTVKSASEKCDSGSETHSGKCRLTSATGKIGESGTENPDRVSENLSASENKATDPNSATETHPNGTDPDQRGCQGSSATEKKRDLSGSDRHSPKRTKVSSENSASENKEKENEYEKRENEEKKGGGGGGREEGRGGGGGKRTRKTPENSASENEEKENKNGENEKQGSREKKVEKNGGGGGGEGLTVWQGTEEATDVLYARLKEVDPETAASYHPNERRKIIRSLQVWEQTGRPHSAILREQRQQEGGSGLGGALRYPNTLIFWLTCDQDVLLARLDARVDEMIERGLLQELTAFHASYNAGRVAAGGGVADYTKGVFQSIGFKEFHKFLVLGEEERASEGGRRLYQAGVDAMKLATRQYTKKQLRWIKNRFLSPSDRKVPPVFTLDATDPSLWSATVGEPARGVVEAVIAGRVPPLPPANPPLGPDSARRNTKSRHECEVCQRVLIGDHIWLAHLNGARHRKMVKRRAALLNADGNTAGGGRGGNTDTSGGDGGR